MQKPVLIDLDGVLRLGSDPAEDTNIFLEYLRSSNRKACILSNSSLYTSDNIYSFFEANSIKIDLPIITAIDAAGDYVRNKYSKVAVYVSDNVLNQFIDIVDFENPEAVLIGDIGNKWNYHLIQNICEYVKNGAELIAIHKNKIWNNPEVGPQLDAGPFIHAIEYAASTSATLIGKPSPLYFHLALEKIHCNLTDSFIMIGDDLESDIMGAKKIGAETILIFTGKTKPPLSTIYSSKIDHKAYNLFDVIEILKNLDNQYFI